MTAASSIRDVLAQGARVAALHADETGRPGKFGAEAARNHLKGKHDPVQDAWMQNTRELRALHEAPLIASLKRESGQGRSPAVLLIVLVGVVGGGFLLWRSPKVRAWAGQLRKRLSRSGIQAVDDRRPEERRESLPVVALPTGNEGRAPSA